MAQVTFSKNIETREILPTAGKYGHGLDYPADVECDRFEWDTAQKPAYAKDDPSRHFALWRFKVVYEGKTIFVTHHEPIDPGTGSRAKEILLSMGVEMAENGEEFSFDPDTVAPRKITGIEVGDPRSYVPKGSTEKVYATGNLTGVRVIG